MATLYSASKRAPSAHPRTLSRAAPRARGSTAGDAPAARSTCGAFGAILGGYNIAGQGVSLQKTFDLATMPHDQLRVSMDFIKIDGWYAALVFSM